MSQDHTVGCTYMTLDKPFTICMTEFEVGGPGGHKVKWDSQEKKGIQVVWCWKYSLGGTKGITFMHAGLMFLQLLTDQQHYANQWTAAAIMKDNIAELGSRVATAGGFEPSSSPTRPERLTMALPPW